MWMVEYTYRRPNSCSELRAYKLVNGNTKLPTWVCTTVRNFAGKENGVYSVWNKNQVKKENE